MTSKIEWTRNADGTQGRTWEVVRGCSHASTGCNSCYAERLTWRLAHNPVFDDKYKGLAELRGGLPRWTGEVRCDASVLEQPLRWRKPTRVFVCSRSDLFHEKVPDEFIAAVFDVMADCPQHTFIVLTKRAERMRKWFEWMTSFWSGTKNYPRHNTWVGVTVENQAATKRLDDLVATPAAVRFVSYEPALEGVDFSRWVYDREEKIRKAMYGPAALNEEQAGSVIPRPIDWVIAGSESGPHARPAQLDWFRSARDQCVAAGVPFFFKQWVVDGKKISTPELDGQRWVEYPNIKERP